MLSLKSSTQELVTKGIIDTRNTISEGCALDAEVHSKFGVGFKIRGEKAIDTAHKNGSKLVKEGVSNTLIMIIYGFDLKLNQLWYKISQIQST